MYVNSYTSVLIVCAIHFVYPMEEVGMEIFVLVLTLALSRLWTLLFILIPEGPCRSAQPELS